MAINDNAITQPNLIVVVLWHESYAALALPTPLTLPPLPLPCPLPLGLYLSHSQPANQPAASQRFGACFLKDLVFVATWYLLPRPLVPPEGRADAGVGIGMLWDGGDSN